MTVKLFGLPLLMLFALNNAYANTQSDNVDQAFARLEQQVQEANFLAPQLDFASWLNLAQSQSQIEPSTIVAWQQQLKQLSPAQGCQQIRYDNLSMFLNLLHNRTLLLQQLPNNTKYSNSFHQLANGKAWYLHWLNSWLLLDGQNTLNKQHLKFLQHIATIELDKVAPLYMALSASLPAKPLTSFRKSHQMIIENELKQRHRLVEKSLPAIFGRLPELPSLNIDVSSLPESFPAPGFYDSASSTFYYHFTGDWLEEKSLDWLYLHEALPGHHMQSNVATIQPICQPSRLLPTPFVSSEGWAAYVETLGEQIGLFKQPESLHYAYEWRMLRALRVLIDIGLHFEGWNEQQALKLWQNYLPHQINVGKREIARIKRWPVQVITYVYGKYHIEQLIAAHKHHGIDEAQLRNTILRLSNHPPVSDETFLHFLTKGS